MFPKINAVVALSFALAGVCAVSNAEVCTDIAKKPAALPVLHVVNVKAFTEYSDQSNQKGARVFVLRFNEKVRNRNGLLKVKVDGVDLQLPVRSTVGEVDGAIPAYDAPTNQLEVREWAAQYRGGFNGDAKRRLELLNAMVESKAVAKLELETCPTEFDVSLQKLVDAKYLHPDYQFNGKKHEFFFFELSAALPNRSNGELRATVDDGGDTKYVWFFIYPNGLKDAPNRLFLTNQVLDLPWSAERLGEALAGRRVGLVQSAGNPWTPLANPFP